VEWLPWGGKDAASGRGIPELERCHPLTIVSLILLPWSPAQPLLVFVGGVRGLLVPSGEGAVLPRSWAWHNWLGANTCEETFLSSVYCFFAIILSLVYAGKAAVGKSAGGRKYQPSYHL
jgi:hypothetical protein